MKRSGGNHNPPLLYLLTGIFLLISASAQAFVFSVNDAASLAAAVATANTNNDASNTINMVGGTYTLAAGTQLDIADSVGTPPDLIQKDLTINGAGAGTTIINGSGNRVFNIQQGALVYLNNLTISNGTVTGNGGGIYNDGTCYLVNINVYGNTASANGGGVYNAFNGYLSIDRSTLSGNTATVGDGGAIYNTADGVIDILNGTLSGNTAGNQGGGIFNVSNNPVLGVNIYNATIVNNTAAGGGGIATQIGMYLINTIVANNPGNDCLLPAIDSVLQGDYNLESGVTCNFTTPAQHFSIQNANPLLGALNLNAPGSTATHALTAGSPAINRGFELGILTTDQRGVARQVQYDIGAYESADAPYIDLSIFKAGPNTPVNLGTSFDFNIQVTNNTMGTTATGVIVTDTLDPKLSFVESIPAGCTANGQTIECTLPDVVGGSFQSVTIRVNSSQGGAIDNTAEVTGAQIDEDPTNNSDTFTVEVFYPLPVITTLDPASTLLGAPAFILTVTGSDFADLAKVRWNGSDLVTQFISPAELRAQIPSGLTANGVAAAITVFNPEPGGGESAPMTFNVFNPQPNIVSLTPAKALSGGNTLLQLTVNGFYFITGATVVWNLGPNQRELTTTYDDPNTLLAVLTPQDLAVPGTIQLFVKNPPPAVGDSNVMTFLLNQGYHRFIPLFYKP